MTGGLEQYHKPERDLEGIKNANCMAHARRHFANAIKVIGKSNPEVIQSSIAYKALVRIGSVYDLEGGLKELSPEERLKERQRSIKPLLEEFFTWIHEIKSDQTVLPKGENRKRDQLLPESGRISEGSSECRNRNVLLHFRKSLLPKAPLPVIVALLSDAVFVHPAFG